MWPLLTPLLLFSLTGEYPKVFEDFGVRKRSKSANFRANLVEFRVEKGIFCLNTVLHLGILRLINYKTNLARIACWL